MSWYNAEDESESPWRFNLVHLTQEAINAIIKQAIDEYPSECCGIVTGTNIVLRVHALVNIQDRLHADDPATHPRTSREA